MAWLRTLTSVAGFLLILTSPLFALADGSGGAAGGAGASGAAGDAGAAGATGEGNPGYPLAGKGTPGAIVALPCAQGNPWRCMAALPLAYKKKVELPIAFDFDTGWIPDSSALQVRFYVKLPAYTQVEMQGGVFATWPGAITLDPFGLRGTGKVEFDYGLMIGAQAKFQVEVLGKDYGWEGDIPFVPKVDFHVDGYRAFDPWAWQPGVIATGYTPKLTLFTVDITDALIPIPGIGGGILLDVQGELGVRYTTDRIVITPTNGTVTSQIDQDITGPDQQALHTWQQGAWGEYLIHPEGRVEYGGTIHLIPTFYIEILTKKFKIPVYDFEYEVKIAEQQWVFDDQLVHVPLPDVRAPAWEQVSAGEVTLGEFQVIEIPFSNIGEATARLDAEVDHPAFKLMDTFAEISPGQEKKIRIRYTPTKLGSVQGKLRVTSNDPDQPEFLFALEGNAVAPPPDPDSPTTSTPSKPPPPKDGTAGSSNASSTGTLARNGEASQEGGCGCRTTTAPSSRWAFAPLLLILLALRRSSSSRFRSALCRQETTSP